MIWKIKLTLVLGLLMSVASLAQKNEPTEVQTLQLDEIIAMALKQNYDIAIAKNTTKVAVNNATKGQAGYYPNVNLNGNANYSNNNTTLTFAGGIPPAEVNGAQNTSLGANIGFNYILFDGFGRVNTYYNLMTNSKLNQVQAQVVAENLVLDIVNRYLDIQQSQLNLEAAQQNMVISADRLRRVTIANKNGTKSKLDVLSAQVDLNNDSLSLFALVTTIEKQKATLNTLMGRPPSAAFSIPNTIDVPADLNVAETRAKALENNATLLLAQLSQDLANGQVEIAKGNRLPTLSLTGSYGYINAQNGAGIVLSQTNLGFSSGLTFSMPIFNGNQLNTAIKNANLSEQNSALEIAKAKLNIENQLRAAELDSKLITRSLLIEQTNVELAEMALSRAKESYANGQISYNDIRLAQLNLLVAKNNANQAKINLVKLYYSLSRISGGLLGDG
jgi:outer membrane protein